MENQDDYQDLCKQLNQLTPGFLPRNVFQSVARIMVTTTFVVVPLLRREDRTLVLLERRSADDLYYPSMLNISGTVIRASDENLSAVFKRLVALEMSDAVIGQGPVFVGNVYDRIVRGKEISLIHWVELEDSLDPERLFDVEALPSDVVPTDRARIAMAVDHFHDRMQI
jgi:hypothetical protein